MSKTPLTAKAIEAAQPQDKPYKLTDSQTPGLFLLVHPNGSKYWRFRYWIDKKERLQAIGVYPLISLKEARKRATESRLLIAQGIDPMDLARKEKAIDALNMAASFKTVAEDWFATRVSGWSESYTKQVRSALEKDVYPVLGKRSIVDITARDVLALLQKKERTAPEQARKLRQRIGEIFKFAVITELVNRNPVADLDTALKARRPGHNAWIQISEIPAFYKALERAGSVQIQTAIRLLILTALRTAELRLMRWEWVDLESKSITLPAEVMKARRPHVVPLSRQAVELLQDQFTRSGYSAFVFLVDSWISHCQPVPSLKPWIVSGTSRSPLVMAGGPPFQRRLMSLADTHQTGSKSNWPTFRKACAVFITRRPISNSAVKCFRTTPTLLIQYWLVVVIRWSREL